VGASFVPQPKLASEPFLKLWKHEVFKLLLAKGKITAEVVENIRGWQHWAFSVEKSLCVEAKDAEGLQRLIEYFLRWATSMMLFIRQALADVFIMPPDLDELSARELIKIILNLREKCLTRKSRRLVNLCSEVIHTCLHSPLLRIEGGDSPWQLRKGLRKKGRRNPRDTNSGS
jgi:hypothetical protein